MKAHTKQRERLAELKRVLPDSDLAIYGDSLSEQIEGAQYEVAHEIAEIDERIRRLDLASRSSLRRDDDATYLRRIDLRDRRDVLHAALHGVAALRRLQRGLDLAIDASDEEET